MKSFAHHKQALNYFVNRLGEYNLACSQEGNFYNPVTLSPMSDNEVICMMRRDYLQSGQPLSGKELKLVLTVFIKYIKKHLQGLFSRPDFKEHIRELSDTMEFNNVSEC